MAVPASAKWPATLNRGTIIGGFSDQYDASWAVESQVADQSPRQESTIASVSSESGRIREYQLLAKLGQGGMGTVYQAQHTKLKRLVALKILPADRMQDTHSVQRFEREMEAVGQLCHPNIVAAHDAGEVDGTHYLVMELVVGVDLASLLKHHGPLAVADACELVRQAAVGLTYVHERGMVHRDIKPSNLMLTRDDTGMPLVKILDLGLALLDEVNSPGRRGLTSEGQIMGTLDFMAPEQAMESHLVDIRADIYSLGSTLYTLLCGHAPFAGDQYNSPAKLLLAVASQQPPPMQQRRAGLPAELVAIVDRCLATNPDDRFARPMELVRALEPLSAGHRLIDLLEKDSRRACKSAAESFAPGETQDWQCSPAHAVRDAPTTAEAELSTTNEHQAPLKTLATDPAKPPWRRLTMAAAFGGFLFLGVILTVATKRGTVVAEGPEGKPLPSGVTVVLTGGGEKIEITAQNRWTVRAAPDEFQVKVRDSQDRFYFKDKALTVERFGRTVLKVSRKPAASMPESSGPIGGAVSRLPANITQGREPTQPRSTADDPKQQLPATARSFQLDANAQRRVALAVIEAGGKIFIEAEDNDGPFGSPAALPNQSFIVSYVDLVNCPQVDGGWIRSHLVGLDRLNGISLNYTRAGDEGVRHILQFKSISFLNLHSVDVSDEGLQGISSLLRLEQLNLSNNPRITDASMEHLRKVSNLKQVQLGGTSVGDEGLRILAESSLPRLVELDICETRVSDRGLEHLTVFSGLRELCLESTLVSDAGIGELSKLTNLNKIWLSGSQVTQTGLERLRDALPECKVRN